MKALVTGAAGFIGFHVTQRLLAQGHEVVGLDAFTPYYDVGLKERRVAALGAPPGFSFERLALENADGLLALFDRVRPDLVVHLAAQAGVRYSIENPRAYLESNIVGTFNLLEACRRAPPRHLLLASTSSAYGANRKHPFEETDPAVHPITLYAASKGSTELMAHAYAHLFAVPTTAFRFFTVYGPWGRPDMAYYLFTKAILEGRPIQVFNHGEVWRDFTFVDDLVDAILALADTPPPPATAREGVAPVPGDTLSPVAPYRLVNIGGGRPARVTEMIGAIEDALRVRAEIELRPLPPGDVVKTFASAELLRALVGRVPETPLAVGIPAFVDWYRTHRN